jgi:excinuclease ABC subunit C
MVVFEDGLPAKAAYRHFSIKTVEGNDDYAAMKEVLSRRLKRWNDDRLENSSRRGFASPADLLLIDGGPGQLGVVVDALEESGLRDATEVASLAKRFEEIYLPGSSTPIRLPRGSEGLFLLQRIRDEAHRFAIGFHRSTRGKAMVESILDGIAGLGPSRRARLLEHFGTIEAVRGANLEELTSLEWLPTTIAMRLHDQLHAEAREDDEGDDGLGLEPLAEADSLHG